MDAADYRELGKSVCTSGQLRKLREELGLSRTAVASFMGVGMWTYTRAERLSDGRLRGDTLERVGRFYDRTWRQLQILSEAGITLSSLMPFHEVAEMRGLTQEGLFHMYRNGELPEAVDLGVLGLWLPR